MKLVTGNDLVSGEVVWWTGTGWSRHVREAADVAADALGSGEAIAAREEAGRRVNVPYVVDAAPGAEGPFPTHIKERIRATGPTVRPDLAVAPLDAAAGSWTI